MVNNINIIRFNSILNILSKDFDDDIFQRYWYNYKKHHGIFGSLIWNLPNFNFCNILQASFTWGTSNEGYHYWQNVYDLLEFYERNVCCEINQGQSNGH